MARGEIEYKEFTKASLVFEELRGLRPRTKRDLSNYVRVYCGINVPDKRICAGHKSPMDYLWHSFSCDFSSQARPNADAVVWANRGGGKTEMAAIATLLDCVFKAGCQVRILAGSGEQAGRMYEYLRRFLGNGFEVFLDGDIRNDRCHFLNGSSVEVLTQSEASVRGQHIQKLRCDEVELFKPRVFSAAKFTTQSNSGIVSALEAISTMHRPYGLMHTLVSQANANGAEVFKWCIWEVIEKCIGRSCSQCSLWSDCRGIARNADGYLKIDDCITMMHRSSRACWETEMLCRRPSLENVVFDEFDACLHVGDVAYNPELPLYRSLDFGFVNPFVGLWIQVDDEGVVRVIDEYVSRRATVEVNAQQIKQRTPCDEDNVACTFCDPAGMGRNDVTGTSAVRELRSAGITVRYRSSRIGEGIELVRRAVKAGDGTSHLIISRQCLRLIEAMQCYHYPEDAGRRGSELPVKDGVYDHPIDALRYFFVNYKRLGNIGTRMY
ncbi:MAG: phage terminase large subunit family protein [Planctomycetota bacterium]|jgi:hypothetical protein